MRKHHSNDFPALLRNELRRLRSVKILDFIYSKPEMKVKGIEELMFNCYHGNEEKVYASNCDSLSKGFGLFKHLFDLEDDFTDIVTDQDMVGSASSKRLRLLGKFHRKEDRNFYAGRNNVICVEKLEHSSFSQNSPLVSGRTLVACSKESLKTIKEAISIVKPLLNDDGTP
jgi:hypothetical protein